VGRKAAQGLPLPTHLNSDSIDQGISPNWKHANADILEKLASNDLSLEQLQSMNLLLKIEAIDYQDIVEWAEAQRAVDTSL